MSSWWVMTFWEEQPMLLVSWMFWVVFSICLHELGHGWAAIRAGDRTPIETGHMTWNPLVHMGTASLVVFGLVGIAWGAMPVNPRRFRGRYDEAVVSAAGPGMNVGLFFACLALLVAWVAAAGGYWWQSVVAPERLFDNVQTFLRVGAVLNMLLLTLNLIPIPPLDGSRILASFWPGYGRLWRHEGAPILAMVLLVGLLLFSGGALFPGAIELTGQIEDALLRLIAPGAL
ncbi:MAG: site-2 protease family protein [Phycisphaerales bacterium]